VALDSCALNRRHAATRSFSRAQGSSISFHETKAMAYDAAMPICFTIWSDQPRALAAPADREPEPVAFQYASRQLDIVSRKLPLYHATFHAMIEMWSHERVSRTLTRRRAGGK
jgi:hypothetical protein